MIAREGAGDGEIDGRGDGTPHDRAAAASYLMGLDDAFRRQRRVLMPAAANRELSMSALVAAAVDRVLGEWLPAAANELGLPGAAAVLGARRTRDLMSEWLRPAVSVLADLGDGLRSLLQGPASPPPSAQPAPDDWPLPERDDEPTVSDGWGAALLVAPLLSALLAPEVLQAAASARPTPKKPP
jgi:hypothetical protein